MRLAPASFAFSVLLGLFAALPALSVDLSAPTLALLPGALGTTQTIAGLTLSLFMVGFALGQLGGGNLSDGHGRRPVLLGGLACFTLAGMACAMARTGEALTLFRLIQGFGAGACAVIAFAMVQDLFEGEAARAKRTYVTVIFGIVPLIAPALGSALTSLFGWRAVHWVLALAGALLFAVTWAGVAESRSTRVPPAVSRNPGGTGRLWDDTRFVRLTIANALSYGAIFAYISGSPVVIMGQMGWSAAVFASVFTSTAASMVAGAWTSGRLSRRGASALALVNPGLIAAAGAASVMAAAGVAGLAPGVILMPVLLTICFARGIVAPNLQHMAIERQRDRAGAASAAVGVTQLLTGAAASAAVALLIPAFGANAVAVPMALFTAAALVTWRNTRP